MVVMRTQRARLALLHPGRINGVGSFYLTIVFMHIDLFAFTRGKQRTVHLFHSCHLLSKPRKALVSSYNYKVPGFMAAGIAVSRKLTPCQ